ncbi:Hypothetical predicted protein [Mytilus galloprovincialis]|uniref:C-type lectin domain-containing protein n=1 Tax=Mytilus galloprovincialis TaxID=29158 RepID=A0A8B6BHC1_MYTGA|nr:Hypothetical predicted protein [Mytilus galloprovincialis]
MINANDHTYDDPNEGYTVLASISDNYRKYDDLKPSGSHHSNFEPQPEPKPYHVCKDVKIKVWIAFKTVIIIGLVTGLTHIVIQSRYSTEVCITSKDSGNAGFRISEIWTKCPNDWKSFDVWCYREFSERRTWFQARDYCRSIGTDLVSVHSERETNFLITDFTQTFQLKGLSKFLKTMGKIKESDIQMDRFESFYVPRLGIDEPIADNNLCVKSSTMYGNLEGDSCSNSNRVT